jgi:hypothetical protein
MRSHTSGVLTLGKGLHMPYQQKAEANHKSSTEAVLVGVNDVLSQVFWTRRFLNAQEYGVNDPTVYQDNQSVMLLEKNIRASSSKHTRHFNFRFFFVHEKVKIKRLPSNIVLQRKWLLTSLPSRCKVPLSKMFVTYHEH